MDNEACVMMSLVEAALQQLITEGCVMQCGRYPITDRALLIKCGVVLACVISCFFLHPITHLEPAWVSIMGAVWYVERRQAG